MGYTDEELFKNALGFYTSNALEVWREAWEEDNWDNVIKWEPFEYYEDEEFAELVHDLYDTFKDIRDKK